jgi:myo-inositol 2-dehydrogenase/D-chiro-inositol 1-dehydrogenase
MADLRVAVVGCGRMGRERAVAATQWGAHVVELCDLHGQAARGLAADLPACRVLTDPQRLSWDRLGAVFLCTPPHARTAVAVAAIQRGIPVFIEKPVALSAEQCAPILQALRVRPVLTAVGYMNRYRASVQRARQALAGRTILGAACHWVGGVYRVPWWRQRDLSGGPINEQATHIVDLARYLIGEIAEVHGIMDPPRTPSELVHSAAFHVRFAAGPLGTMFYSCMSNTKMITFEVFTPDFPVQLAGWDFQLVADGTDVPPPPPDPTRQTIFHDEVAAFLDDVTTTSRRRVLCDFEDAVRTQQVVDDLVRSLERCAVGPVGSAAAMPDERRAAG